MDGNEGTEMRVSRELVVAGLRKAGHHDRALTAACALPAVVDTVQDAGVLVQLQLNIESLERRAKRSLRGQCTSTGKLVT